MRYRENTSADVVMSSQKNTYRMFKNTEVMYEKRKELPDWKRMLIVSKNITIKEAFICLLPPLSCSLPTNAWGFVPHVKIIKL